jgi:hypothetical protein
MGAKIPEGGDREKRGRRCLLGHLLFLLIHCRWYVGYYRKMRNYLVRIPRCIAVSWSRAVSVLLPDHAALARAVADNLVISADPVVSSVSAVWSEASRPLTAAVARAVLTIEDEEIRLAAEHLLGGPAEPRLHADMVRALLARDPDWPPLASLYERAWAAECNSRLGYHLGSQYDPAAPAVTADDLQLQPPGPSLGADDYAEIGIIIPFRDQGSDRGRLRNLLACLTALRDQSYPRSGYRVTVVESDKIPRWRPIIASYADHYLFAPDPGPFNKSWTVNVGVVHSPGRPEVICILDGDVLADRNFVARNTDRLRHPGTGAHLTYRNMCCLDPQASSKAIAERISRQQAEVNPEQLRGFFLRRPPGCCIWVRTDAFHRIGGMDERYRGWGGEDYDFAHRLSMETPLDTYDDWLLHLHHRPAVMATPYRESANASIPSLSWPPTGPIGRLAGSRSTGKRVGLEPKAPRPHRQSEVRARGAVE